MSQPPQSYSYLPSPTPARLTALAAGGLPRWGLFAVALLYSIAGLIFRDPWKTEDVVGLAQMLSAYQGDWRAWMWPQAAGIAIAQEGPLSTWLGALSMHLFGGVLGTTLAGRVPNLLWFGLTVVSLWYATYLLGRRPEAQPLALPFGGQPAARDYGRMLADVSVLFLLATLGIIWRTHETSAEPAALAMSAVVFFGLVRALDQPLQGALWAGLGLGGAFLARGFPGALPLLLGLLLALALFPAAATQRLRMLAVSVPLAVCLGLAWWIPTALYNPDWLKGWWYWHRQVIGLLSLQGLDDLGRNLPWFLWPTGPLTLVALWRWRHHFSQPHLLIPGSLLIGSLLALVLTHSPMDSDLLALVTPCAVFAALSLPTLRRGLINALDWFSVMVFTLVAGVIWLGWIAMMTGIPVKVARNIARLTPGFDVPFSLLGFILAMLCSLAWVALIVWRLRVRPSGLWRGSILSAGGVLVNWLLLMTLWLPSINYSKSYRNVSNGIATEAAHYPNACIQGRGVGLAQRASFAVFNGLTLSTSSQCPLMLVQDSAQDLWDRAAHGDLAGATLIWEGGRASNSRRPSERREYFMLFHRPDSN